MFIRVSSLAWRRFSITVGIYIGVPVAAGSNRGENQVDPLGSTTARKVDAGMTILVHSTSKVSSRS
ncbi:MAG: hypothetical protein ACYCQJ_15690 [Nitrososphaerales archaeon]